MPRSTSEPFKKAAAGDGREDRQGLPQPRQRRRGVRQGRQGRRGHAITRRWPRTPRWSRRRPSPRSRADRAILWTPTQNPQAVQDTVAAALGIDKKNVEVHVTLLGGGFGRKSKPDYCAEAAVLSRKLGKPVKVIWTREDDIRFDYYHSTAAVYHKAVVDGRGKPTAWLQRSAFPPIASTFAAGAREPLGLRAGSRPDRSALRHREHPRRERPGRRARPHRLVPLGLQHVPRVCRAQLRRRTGAGGAARLAGVHARHARPGQGARPEGRRA